MPVTVAGIRVLGIIVAVVAIARHAAVTVPMPLRRQRRATHDNATKRH